MFTDQIERDFVMVKTRAMRLDAIMAAHAVCTKGQAVFSDEGRVNLEMTIHTRSLIERRRVSAYMAILTDKCGSIRFGLMRSQFE